MKRIYCAFSLVEVLIVLAILAWLATAYTPTAMASFSTDDERMLLKQAQTQLTFGLNRARQLAVKAKQEVMLCGGQACDGNWSQGWEIRVNNQLISHHLFPAEIDVQWKGFPKSKKYILFLPSGHSGYQNGTFRLCVSSLYALVILNQSGRYYSAAIASLNDASVEVSC